VSVDGGRRAEILETAARLFASSGLRTSLQQIAAACGILPGSLYHHFESKEAIVVELIERYRADLVPFTPPGVPILASTVGVLTGTQRRREPAST
jgi:AcrR family transcriptional regulator